MRPSRSGSAVPFTPVAQQQGAIVLTYDQASETLSLEVSGYVWDHYTVENAAAEGGPWLLEYDHDAPWVDYEINNAGNYYRVRLTKLGVTVATSNVLFTL